MPPLVSIILPVRNEEQHISRCLQSIAAQDYPRDRYEIIIIDGLSTDATLDKISEFRIHNVDSSACQAGNHTQNDNIRVLTNPKRTVTTGLNLGIAAARGDVIMRMDAHALYAPDYISSCLKVMEETGAANVGGHMRALPGADSATAGAIMLAHYSPFGLGGGKFHDPDYQGFVDTVWLGCYQREVFDRIGPFTEPFTRTEDLDLNSRLRAAGYKIYLSPRIKAFYFARGRLAQLWRQRWADGAGIIQTLPVNFRAPQFRHLVPLIFVGTLGLLGILAVLRLALWTFFDYATWFGLHYASRLFSLEIILWLAAAVFFTFKKIDDHGKTRQILAQARALSGSGEPASLRSGPGGESRSSVPNDLITVPCGPSPVPCSLSPVSYLLLPWVFASLHFSYGLGSLWGIFTAPRWLVSLRHPVQVKQTGEVPAEPPLVSVILPVRNEGEYIEGCLRSIMAQSYPHQRMELLVVDGLSTDGTLDKINKFRIQNSEFKIQVLSNPNRTVPYAMNLGIRAARGTVIVRFDGHAQMPVDYLEKCVAHLYRTGVQNVGGPARAVAGTAMGQAIMLAQYSPFGLGGADFRTGYFEGLTDTVTFGCFLKEDLLKYGLYDHRLNRNQDIELNARIRKNGGKVCLCSEIFSYYFCRRTLTGLFSQNFRNGQWAVYTKVLFPHTLSLRHFTPLCFVLSLAFFGLWAYGPALNAAPVLGRGFFWSEVLAYFLTMSFFTAAAFFTLPQMEQIFAQWHISRMEMEGLSFAQAYRNIRGGGRRQVHLAPTVWLISLLPAVFVTLHLSYGLGSIWGLLTLPGWLRKSRKTQLQAES